MSEGTAPFPQPISDHVASPGLSTSDIGLFNELTDAAASAYGLDAELVKADYWLIRSLHEIGRATAAGTRLQRPYADPPINAGSLVFGGGTSLTAAWDISQRWSEDIDLTLDPLDGANPKQLRAASKSLAMRIAQSMPLTMHPADKSAGHYFFTLSGTGAEPQISVDIVFKQVEHPMMVRLQPVQSMIGRIADSNVMAAYPELGGFGFQSLGPGSTAMNKLLAQTKMAASGLLDRIAYRARDIYDLACIARVLPDFGGHLHRDGKALLWLAEKHRASPDDPVRPPDGFASLPQFDPSTREHEALARGYEIVLDQMVWGDKIPLDEAIRMAVSLDPGPSEPPPQPAVGPYVATPPPHVF